MYVYIFETINKHKTHMMMHIYIYILVNLEKLDDEV